MESFEQADLRIADSERTDDAVRESDQRFRTLADLAPAMLWLADRGRQCTYLSRGWYEYTGHTEAQSLGTGWADAIHPEDRALVQETFQAAAERHEPFRLDYRLRRADGEYRWVIDSGRPRISGEGVYSGYIGCVIDVHERKRAEQALRDSEERYRAVVESQAEMLCRFRRDGTIEFVNGPYARARGTTPEELIGRSFWDFVAEADRPAVMALLDRLTPEAPEVAIENRFETVDGERWTLWTNRGLSFDADGRVVEAQSSGIDITERKVAEEALRRRFRELHAIYRLSAEVARAAQLEHILEAAMDGLIDAVSADRASVLLFDESAVMRFKGWRGLSREYRRAVEGHTPWGPSDADARPIAVSDVTADAELADVRDTILAEGIRALSFIPLLFGGRVLGKFMVYYDRPHEFSQQELRVCETIAGHVAYAIERARSEQALRDADQRKDEFLATLGHELRNPLAPLHNMLQVLKRDDVEPDTLRRARDVMERQVSHLVRLVDDLLDVSRITRGKLKLCKERIDLRSVVNDALENFAPVCEGTGHRLTANIPERPIYLDADPVRLTQVIENLLNNAWKYTGRGGRIRLAIGREGPEAVIRVQDSGIGIEPERLSRIFDVFSHTEDRPEDRQGGGLGIGLSLAKSLVALHGGTIEARSEGRGRGAEFVVRVPVREEPAVPRKQGISPTAAETTVSCTVLVVDDNRDNAESLATLLELSRHDVHIALDGMEAVEKAAELAPDVILLDLGMPKLNGYDAARLIRAREGGDRILLVALTGWGQEEDRRRSRAAGFDAHLVKPLNLAEFNGLLSELRSG